MGLTAAELKKHTADLIAQIDTFERGLIELSIFANGSVTYADLLNMTIKQVEVYEKSLNAKIKFDKGIKTQQML
jgi:hypothetical protein